MYQFHPAGQLRIKLLFLPGYSLNLNLIERLWKFVKKQALYNIYYETFASFKSGITDCWQKVNSDYKNVLKNNTVSQISYHRKSMYYGRVRDSASSIPMGYGLF